MNSTEALTIVSGRVNQELLLRNEYLAAENEILRSLLPERLPLTDAHRARLAHKLGRKALAGMPTVVTPETLMAWYRRLVAKKFTHPRTGPGRPPVDTETRELIIKMATDNPGWGYKRIVGELKKLELSVSSSTVANILEEAGVPPNGTQRPKTSWAEFLESHKDVITACDFFHVEVCTAAGLVTYSVFFLMQLATRQVHIAGIRANPHGRYMCQIVRNLTMADWGWLNGQEYLIMDRDPLFTADFRQILQDAGVNPVRLPPRSPNMNALAERLVRTITNDPTRDSTTSHLYLHTTNLQAARFGAKTD